VFRADSIAAQLDDMVKSSQLWAVHNFMDLGAADITVGGRMGGVFLALKPPIHAVCPCAGPATLPVCQHWSDERSSVTGRDVCRPGLYRMLVMSVFSKQQIQKQICVDSSLAFSGPTRS
jgi:hypothetical protein